MYSAMVELAVLLLVAWFVWRFVDRRISGSRDRSAEPGDYAGRPARLRPRHGRGSSAVALAEPDEEEDELT
jgi:peptidoglycan/LPS O-acetylase OafA/YrhL